MRVIALLKNKNILIAMAIGGALGLMAGGKGEGSLVGSVLFGLAVGGFVGWLGLPRAKTKEDNVSEKDQPPQ